MVLTSTHPEREKDAEKGGMGGGGDAQTLLTFRTWNLEKASVRMKGQTEAAHTADPKTTDADEKRVLEVERWSLLQRERVMTGTR